MIRLTFTNCKWGTDPLVDSPEPGIQINLLDEESQIMAHVPFSGDALANLAFELINGMTPEQRDLLEGRLRGEDPEPAPESPAAKAPANGGGKKKDEAPPASNPFLAKKK